MKLVALVPIAILAGVFLTSCLPNGQLTNPSPSANDVTPEAELKVSVPNMVLVATESGQSAFDLLQSHATIETQDYGQAGVFVTGINGLTNTSQNYWAFYINGEYSQTGASQTMLEPGDEIKFVYEAIDPNQL